MTAFPSILKKPYGDITPPPYNSNAILIKGWRNR